MSSVLAMVLLGSIVGQAAELRFSELDRDSNGALSFSELRAGAPGLRRETFNDYDFNDDGVLNVNEFKSWRDDHAAGRGLRR